MLSPLLLLLMLLHTDPHLTYKLSYNRLSCYYICARRILASGIARAPYRFLFATHSARAPTYIISPHILGMCVCVLFVYISLLTCLYIQIYSTWQQTQNLMLHHIIIIIIIHAREYVYTQIRTICKLNAKVIEMKLVLLQLSVCVCILYAQHRSRQIIIWLSFDARGVYATTQRNILARIISCTTYIHIHRIRVLRLSFLFLS